MSKLAKGPDQEFFNFEPLRKTWKRLADERGGECIDERLELDFVMDLERFPVIGSLLLKTLGSMEQWEKNLNFYRPLLKVQCQKHEIALSTMGRVRKGDDCFMVTAEIIFEAQGAFYLRTREKFAWQAITEKLKDNELLIEWQKISNSIILKMPRSMTLKIEKFPGIELMRSGSIELDNRFDIETNDATLMRELLGSWRLREQLIASEESIRTVIVKAVPNTTSSCLLISGIVNAKNIEQSKAILKVAEELLQALLKLEVIS